MAKKEIGCCLLLAAPYYNELYKCLIGVIRRFRQGEWLMMPS